MDGCSCDKSVSRHKPFHARKTLRVGFDLMTRRKEEDNGNHFERKGIYRSSQDSGFPILGVMITDDFFVDVHDMVGVELLGNL